MAIADDGSMVELRPLDPDGRYGDEDNAGVVARSRHGFDSTRRRQQPPSPRPFAKDVTSHNRSLSFYCNNGGRNKLTLLLLLALIVVAILGTTTLVAKRAVIVAESGVEAGGRTGFLGTGMNSSSSLSSTPVNNEEKIAPQSVALVHDGYRPITLVNDTTYVLPGTKEHAEPLSAAAGRPYIPVTNHFQTKDPNSPYAKTWDHFDFTDPDPQWDGKVRPQPLNYDGVPNRDVKNSDFPQSAWQRDNKYMMTFLEQARKLVNRTIEAVYGEYGVGISPGADWSTLSDEQLAGRDLFAPFMLRPTMEVPLPPDGTWSYSTRQSFDGVARRVIHHVMTGDTFKLVLGGHSAAAGHGAGFNQSYIIEAGHILEPVFAHLGVDFRAYNFAQGGMGTFQQAMAGMDLRGKDTDWIVWDSSMTEKSSNLSNFFYRQALISGNRAPILMADSGYLSKGEPLTGFHDIAGAAIAAYDIEGWVPVTDSDEQVKTIPWAAQWLKCSRTATADCKAHEYTAGCWVEREDYTPTTPQDAFVGGQASWHPGNRTHKRRGRMLALVVLRSLMYALEKWEKLGIESGFPIAEEHWHVTEYYKHIREKASTVPGCFGDIWKIGQKRHLQNINNANGIKIDEDFWPGRICDLPLQGRSLWGPRYNPMESSLLSIMKPNVFGDIDPAWKNVYMSGPVYLPPDRPAPWTVPPDISEPFAPLIAAARRLSMEQENQRPRETIPATRILDVAADNITITPGLGLQVSWLTPGVCDGTSHSWCDKTAESSCLMSGSQDNRGTLCFNGYSGWLVFEVNNIKHGFIGARMEAWRGVGEVPITNGWTEVNNGGRGNYGKHGRERRLHEENQVLLSQEGYNRMKREIVQDILAEGEPTRRRLGGGQSCGMGNYTFEWAINRKITSWTKAEFCEHYTRLAYNLDVIKFMDDENLTGSFELAMRMTPDSGMSPMCITHLYWA